jgi:hypothetical protein
VSKKQQRQTTGKRASVTERVMAACEVKNANDHIFFVLQLRMVQPASALGIACLAIPIHSNTIILHNVLVCEFLCQTQACQRGPSRKRMLNKPMHMMMCIGLSLAALGLVSLAGCEVHNPSHFMTEAETIQVVVPSLSELLFRPSVSVSVSFLGHLYRGILLNLAYS